MVVILGLIVLALLIISINLVLAVFSISNNIETLLEMYIKNNKKEEK